MLNLSDKDLDRLSQEAAQQHEPGDIIGPKFWDKLEARLDRDLGKMTPNPARGIRRLPYYYAPAVLVLLGVTYYLVRLNTKSQQHSSGSPPLTTVQPAPAEPLKHESSSPNSVPSDKSNSTLTAPANTVQYPAAPGVATTGAATAGAPTTSGATDRPAGAPASHTSVHPSASSTPTSVNSSIATGNSNNSSRQRRHHNRLTANRTDVSANTGNAAGNTSKGITPQTAASPRAARELTFSAVRGPILLTPHPKVDASNPTSVGEPIHHGLRVNRSLTFGVVLGPDYSSVNSLSGQRPGSTIGLTADYQFANHWYIGSGLLFSRKIYAAASQDYHPPPNYYQQNQIGTPGGHDVDYIKGTFNMLEVPINIRFDFNTGGNLLFFVTAGTSSYFFTREDCAYYFSWYNARNPVDKQMSYTNHPDNLFSSLNLSLGAELGISNSVSVLMAPYYRIPVRNLGFGQVQLSSVGINFALRIAPVISRKRY